MLEEWFRIEKNRLKMNQKNYFRLVSLCRRKDNTLVILKEVAIDHLTEKEKEVIQGNRHSSLVTMLSSVTLFFCRQP